MFGDAGLYLMAGAIMISTFGCNNGLILSAPSLLRDGAGQPVSRSIGVLHSRAQDTRRRARRAGGVDRPAVASPGPTASCSNYVIFAALLFYMLTAIGLFLLRAKRPQRERPVRAAGYPWLPALYVLGTGVLCVKPVCSSRRATRGWG